MAAWWPHILAGLGVILVLVMLAVFGRRQPPQVVALPPMVPTPVATAQRGVREPVSRVTQAAVADPAFLGRAAYREGDYQSALERYREAISRDPDDAESLNNYGQMLVRLGRPADAIQQFERAIDLNHDRWAYHFNLAHACTELGQWDRAIAEYEVASGLFPGDYATEYNFGMALHKRGDEAAAIEHFRRAIDLAPTEADFQLSLGISSERLGRTADAIEAYKRYLDLAATSPRAAEVRARIETLGKAPAAAANVAIPAK